MEKDDRNLNQWVEECLAHLDTPRTWSPDADRGLAGVHRRSRTVRRRRWGLSVAGLAALASALFAIPGCEAATCKVKSENLAERLWNSVFAPEPPVPSKPQPAPPSLVPSPPPAPATHKNHKLTGSPHAPVTCEIYTDYECPACARFYLEVVPQLNAEYVATGKVMLLHRDYPLPQHQYSRLAARYANAAGIAGEYAIAVAQLFRTQSSWGLTGDIAPQLSQVLAPDVMTKVRDRIHSDPHLDDGIAADINQARADQIMRTPSIVLVKNGERRVMPAGDFSALKDALDQLLRP
jgi:protein-disulfide isomerase